MANLNSAAFRTRIEDAIVARLTPLVIAPLTPNGYLQGVRPYNGECHGRDPAEVEVNLNGQMPAILVATGAGEETLQNRYFSHEVIEVEIYLCSRDMRVQEARTRGQVGIYQMATDARILLQGWDLGLGKDVSVLRPGKLSPLLRSRELSIWQLTYGVTIEFQTPARDEGLHLLTSLAGSLNLAGAANPVAVGTDGVITWDLATQTTTFRASSAIFTSAMVGWSVLVLSGVNAGQYAILAFVDEQTVTWTDANGASDGAVSFQLLLPPAVPIVTEVP